MSNDRADWQAVLRDTVPLARWLDLTQRAGVDMIPAQHCGAIPMAEVWDGLRGKPTPAFDAVQSSCGHIAQTMWEAEERFPVARWGHCAPEWVKGAIATGNDTWWCSAAHADLDDPRMIDIAGDVGLGTIDLYVRPYIAPLTCGGYPVELRVYVDEGRIIGVSNYYPQCDLRNLPAETLAEFVYYTVADTAKLLALPDCPAAFTLDFIHPADDAIMVIEGGPPNREWGGAHPCCFEGGEIGGLALYRAEAALPGTEADHA